MRDRDSMRRAFQDRADWRDAEALPLAGDASRRQYFRLVSRSKARQTAILMDASAEARQTTRAFCAIDAWLIENGLSAPQIIYAEPENGLLLLEDLGDGLFPNIGAENTEMQRVIYSAATDALAYLHTKPCPTKFENGTRLPAQTREHLVSQSRILLEHYAPDLNFREMTTQFDGVMAELCGGLARPRDVVVLRDFHAGNLVWLPERVGHAKVGLLDFQDALSGHAAYDLVSLLQDARADIATEFETEMIHRYLQNQDQKSEFLSDYAALGAQRHLRVLGVFAKLAKTEGKTRYLENLPRVWGHLMRNLEHPRLANVQKWINENIPDPSKVAISKPGEL